MVVFIIGSSLIVLVYMYYRIVEPPAKQWGKRILISLFLFSIGGIGVIVDSIHELRLWFLGAIPITLSYILALSSSVHYIKRLALITKTPFEEEKEEKYVPSGAYLTLKTPYEIKELLMLMREKFNGLIVISRDPLHVFLRTTGMKPDKYIWLSRVEAPESTDPTKLHLIQNEILKFISQRKGKVIVYLTGLDYLLLYNDFSSIAKFLFTLKDYLTMNESLLILHLPKNTVSNIQESVITREFKWLDENRLLGEIALFGVMKKESEKDASSESTPRKNRESQETSKEA
ncbi:DUF835 domain-containing protein [Thermococcus sp.]